MPWYWSDEAVSILIRDHEVSVERANQLTATPFAFRSEKESLEDAAEELLGEGELPLAA